MHGWAKVGLHFVWEKGMLVIIITIALLTQKACTMQSDLTFFCPPLNMFMVKISYITQEGPG